ILVPDRMDAGSRGVGSRLSRPPEGGGYVVPRAWHPSVAGGAPLGKILLAEQQVLSGLSEVLSTTTSKTSCRTRTSQPFTTAAFPVLVRAGAGSRPYRRRHALGESELLASHRWLH